MRLIDCPQQPGFTVDRVVESLKQFAGNAIIQTMLLRGEHDGHTVDNTTPAEIDALIDAYRRISPRSVMLYSLDRSTPEEHLVKVPHEELERIATRVRQAGIPVESF